MGLSLFWQCIYDLLSDLHPAYLDGDQCIIEYDANDTLLCIYLYGSCVEQPVRVIETAEGTNYHCDALGWHIIRLLRRFHLSPERKPVKPEFVLADVVPEDNWTLSYHLLIRHARMICGVRNADCPACTIAEHCPVATNPEKR